MLTCCYSYFNIKQTKLKHIINIDIVRDDSNAENNCLLLSVIENPNTCKKSAKTAQNIKKLFGLNFKIWPLGWIELLLGLTLCQISWM